jgi:hypothetical protein
MDPRLWIICGLLALWGLVYAVIGAVKKVTHQLLTGIAVVLLAGSMPLMNQPGYAGWLLVGVAIPLAVAAVVMRVLLLFRQKG